MHVQTKWHFVYENTNANFYEAFANPRRVAKLHCRRRNGAIPLIVAVVAAHEPKKLVKFYSPENKTFDRLLIEFCRRL